MRILFFIESLRSGGKERRLIELIKGLSNNPTIEMEIVLTKDIIHYKEIYLLNVKIHYTKRKEGVKKDPRVFYTFYKIAKKIKPDIIHVWGNLVAIYAIPSKIVLRKPMINSQITDAPDKVSKTLLRHNLSFLFSDKITANSYAGLKTYNSPTDRSCVVYNGFDFNRIKNLKSRDVIRKRFNITTKIVVGMVASFTKKKDYFTYIKSANTILKRNKEVTFLCIGSGDYFTYKEMVEADNIDKVFFLGKQDNVEDIMNICDIGVLTTNNEKHGEGISNALLEFSALGKPVIATLSGGNSELVDQGRTGYLINQSSSSELSMRLELFLNNSQKRINFGQEGKMKVAKDFSIEKMIINFMNLYKKTLVEK